MSVTSINTRELNTNSVIGDVNVGNLKDCVEKGRTAIKSEGGFKNTLKEIGTGLLKGLGFVLQGLLKLIGGALNLGGNVLMSGLGGRMMGGLGNTLSGGRGLLGGLLGTLCRGFGNSLGNSQNNNLGLFGNILGGLFGGNNLSNENSMSNEYNGRYDVPSFNGMPLYNNYNYGSICDNSFRGVNDSSLFGLLASKVGELAKMVGWNTKVNRELTLPMANVLVGRDRVSQVLGSNQIMDYDQTI